MNIDLELTLVIGIFLTGGIWLLDKFLLGPAQRKQASSENNSQTHNSQSVQNTQEAYTDPWYVEYSKSFFPVLLIVLVLRGFIAEPFRIPSGSMMPTLLVGDFILVNKYTYGLRLPVLNTKIWDVGEPHRGDVAVFRFPKKPSDDYIKRVVGLPGDHIAYYNKVLHVNGELVSQSPEGKYTGIGSGGVMSGASLREEKLGAKIHDILVWDGRPNVEGEYIVPPGHYFVMGDNRDNSNDSRFWGFVPEENLVGKAFMIWLNWDISGGVFNFGRIGTHII